MPIVAQPTPIPQAPTQSFLFCARSADLARELAKAKTDANPASTSRRQAGRARHIMSLLRKLHSHYASCPPCLLRETLAAGGGVQ
jgi:hypothetical protein